MVPDKILTNSGKFRQMELIEFRDLILSRKANRQTPSDRGRHPKKSLFPWNFSKKKHARKCGKFVADFIFAIFFPKNDHFDCCLTKLSKNGPSGSKFAPSAQFSHVVPHFVTPGMCWDAANLSLIPFLQFSFPKHVHFIHFSPNCPKMVEIPQSLPQTQMFNFCMLCPAQ